jgi:quercetin dioxygenase-like cupin family protein
LDVNSAGEALPPSKLLTGPASLRRSVCALRDVVSILTQTMGGSTMSKRKWTLMLAGILVVFTVGAIALRTARATPPKGVTNTLIAGPVVLDEIHVVQEDPDYGAMIKTRGQSDAVVRSLSIAPGGDTGWHSHPGPVFALITAGTGSFYDTADPTFTPTVYPAGVGFVEGGGDVHIFRNEGAVDLELSVMFLVPHGAPTRIDEPAPPGAPF